MTAVARDARMIDAIARVLKVDRSTIEATPRSVLASHLDQVPVTDNDRAIAAHCGLPVRDVLLMTEAERIAVVRSTGAVPLACGAVAWGKHSGIGEAPARGPKVPIQPVAAYPQGPDGFAFKPAGYMNRAALRDRDVFDRMGSQYARRKVAFPLTSGQVAMARDYRMLCEQEAAKGTPRSCLSDAGGGSAEGYIQHAIDASRWLALLRSRIGADIAKAVRRRRPSDRRVDIRDRDIVEAVCNGQLTPTELLRSRGWGDRGRDVSDVTQALAAALDRMAGPVRGRRCVHIRTDVAQKFWSEQKGD